MSDYTSDAESIAAAEQEKNERAQRYRDIVTQAYAHVQRGDLLGPPEDRPASDLDAVVEGVVGALRAEVRLYPDLWAWIVSDQVRLALRDDLDAVRAEAQVEALREVAAETERKRSEPGLVHLDVRYQGYYTGIRSGMESATRLLRETADRIAREAGIENKREPWAAVDFSGTQSF